MTTVKIFGFVVYILFYASYFAKMLIQRRKGIFTDRMAKGNKSSKTKSFENYLKLTTYSLAGTQLASILFLNTGFAFANYIWLGLSLTGTAIFITAMVTMRDSWRAGVDTSQKTAIITNGIYKYSRNPAFLGFDLFYIGLAAAFFNAIIALATALAVIMLHLQILQEEKHLPAIFGEEYIKYKRGTARYFGFV